MKLIVPLAASALVLGTQAMASNSETAMQRISARFMHSIENTVEAGLLEADTFGERLRTRERVRERAYGENGGAVQARDRNRDRDRAGQESDKGHGGSESGHGGNGHGHDD